METPTENCKDFIFITTVHSAYSHSSAISPNLSKFITRHRKFEKLFEPQGNT